MGVRVRWAGCDLAVSTNTILAGRALSSTVAAVFVLGDIDAGCICAVATDLELDGVGGTGRNNALSVVARLTVSALDIAVTTVVDRGHNVETICILASTT